MCNLYSLTKGQAGIRDLFRARYDRTGNLPLFPGIFPDQMAPIVHNSADGEREVVTARSGMLGPPQYGGVPVAYANWMRAAALAGGLVAATAPVLAQVNAREPDPAVWLRQVYDLYHRAEKTPSLEKQATDSLIVKRASRSLAALFKKNVECEAEQKGVCALDWDFVVDGQDVKLANVKVGAPVVAGKKATVEVMFTNFGTPCANVYYFVREGGQWKVEDIETKAGSDAPVRIAKLLSDYDYKQ
jgi:hypothetical protein